MNAAKLAEEFEPVRRGRHKRVELQEHVSDASRYFSESITLPNSNEVVHISDQWGQEDQWNVFKDHMGKRGYPITHCRLVNLEDNENRLWQYCHQFGFVSAGGNSAAGIQKLRQGDILFICRVRIKKELRGCVACGQVKSPVAVDVWDIPTENGKLRNELLEDKKTTYYQRFSKNNTDKAVSVEWIGPSLTNSPVRITGTHRAVCISKINDTDFRNLTDAFQITRTEK